MPRAGPAPEVAGAPARGWQSGSVGQSVAAEQDHSRRPAPADPVDFSPAREQSGRGVLLATVAGPPQRVSQLLGIRWRDSRKLDLSRPVSPIVADSNRFGRTPRATSRSAARHCPNAVASAIGEPPLITGPGASMSAPASSSASISSTSSLLAAQCSAVSAWPPTKGASRSAPAPCKSVTNCLPHPAGSSRLEPYDDDLRECQIFVKPEAS
jgi:hypothetical protein